MTPQVTAQLHDFAGPLEWRDSSADRVAARRDSEDGQAMVEYGLILALISIAAIAIMGTVGGNIVSVFNAVANQLHS